MKSAQLPNSIRKLALLFLFLTVSLFGHRSQAETPGARSCDVSNEQDFTFADLVQMIRNENCNAKSIDDVVSLLPPRMRSKMALFYRSQSLQGPHKDNFLYPRAILSSVRSIYQLDRLGPALMVSFNGHPSQPGYNRLEVVDLNPSSVLADVFTYYEIAFPEDEQTKELTWSEAQLRIKVSEANPKTCQQCHGNPARPIFQAYPLWEGAFGSQHITGMTDYEKKGLDQFVRFHRDQQNSRYRHLNPSRFKSEKFLDLFHENREAGLSDPISFGNANPAVKMNTDLANYNGLRVTRIMKSIPSFDQYRFAIMGALRDCENFVQFFTQDSFSRLKHNINSQNKFSTTNFSGKAKGVFEFFLRQGPYQFGAFWSVLGEGFGEAPIVSEAVKRQRAYWQNDPTLFALWIDTIAKQGKDRSTTDAVKLRFIFEGLGINMNHWWTDLKQPTYRSNSGFGQPWSQALENIDPLLKQLASENGIDEIPLAQVDRSERVEVLEKKYCEKLAGLSRSAMQDSQVPQPVDVKTENQLNQEFPTVFETTCRKCHVDHAVGPAIPFDDKVALKEWLRLGDRAKRFHWRTLQAPETQRMPPTRDLEFFERRQIERYLKSIMGDP